MRGRGFGVPLMGRIWMKNMMRCLVVLFVALVATACTSSMQDSLVRSIAVNQLSDVSDPTDFDGMQALVCGAGSPLPSRDAAGPCIAVLAAGKIWIVDAGSGAAENLQVWNLPGQKIAGVLLTHFHSDHIAEVPDVKLARWVGGASTPMPVYGPEGVGEVTAGYNRAYRQSHQYRVDHHGADFIPPEVAELAPHPIGIRKGDPEGKTIVVLEEDGLRITATKVDHFPVDPAVAYRFDYKGRSVTISGDTEKSDALTKLARGSDVFFHEALADHVVRIMSEAATEVGADRPAKITADIPDYHTSPVEVAEIANEADAKLLIYYHLVPYPNNFMLERIFMRGVSDVRPDGAMLGFDGLLIRLPPNSKEIEIDELEG